VQVVLQQNSIEVHEEGDLAAAEAEIGTRLRLMHGEDALYRLQFKKHGLRDDDIGKVGLVQAISS
jgi:hypothetical protein